MQLIKLAAPAQAGGILDELETLASNSEAMTLATSAANILIGEFEAGNKLAAVSHAEGISLMSPFAAWLTVCLFAQHANGEAEFSIDEINALLADERIARTDPPGFLLAATSSAFETFPDNAVQRRVHTIAPIAGSVFAANGLYSRRSLQMLLVASGQLGAAEHIVKLHKHGLTPIVDPHDPPDCFDLFQAVLLDHFPPVSVSEV